MSKKRNWFRSLLSQWLVLIMVIQLFQNLTALPILAEEKTEELGQIRGTNPVVLEQEGIGFKKEVKAISKDTFEAKITITGNDVAKPADVVLIFDTSSAVKNNLAKIKEKAKTFATELMAGYQGGETKFQMGIVAYDDNGRIEQTLSSDLTSIHAAIDALSAKETTGRFIQDGFWKAREILRSSQNQRVMVLLAGDLPTYRYQKDEKKYKRITAEEYEEGYDIYHLIPSSGPTRFEKGYSEVYTNALVKMDRKGNGTYDLYHLSSLSEELQALSYNSNLYTLWVDMADNYGKVDFCKNYTQNFKADSSDESMNNIFSGLKNQLLTKGMVSGKLFEPYHYAAFGDYTSKIVLSSHKEGGTPQEREDFQRRVDNIKNNYVIYRYISRSGYYFSNITLGAGESISFQYTFKLKESNQDGKWYLMNLPAEVSLNTKKAMKFGHNIELTTKQPKTEIEIFIDWLGGVKPQEENAEVIAYLKQLVNNSSYSSVHETIPVKLNKDNGWRVVLPDMPLAIDGKRCIYHISTGKGEIKLPRDYIVNSTNFRISPDKAKHTFQINLKNIEEWMVHVKKNWLGESPERLALEIYREDSSGARILSKRESVEKKNYQSYESVWYYNFTQKFKKYDDNGNPYKYYLVEKDLDSAVYQSDKAEIELKPRNQDSQTHLHGELTNRNIGKTTVHVKKVWNNTPENLKKSVKIILYRRREGEVAGANRLVQNKIIELNEQNGYTGQFTDLPVYDSLGQSASGRKFIYSVVEENPDSEKFEVSVTGDGSETNPFIITNTNKEKIKISVTKQWFGASQPNFEGAVFDLFKEGEDTPIASIENIKENTTFFFEKNAKGEFLPKYETDGSEVKAIKYSVKERPLDHYLSKTEYDQDVNPYAYTFINVSKIPASKLVTKKWVGPVGEKAVLTLTGDQEVDGKFPTKTITATKSEYGNQKEWQISFDGLRVYGDNGERIRYQLSEEPLSNYIVESLDQENHTITNKYTNSETTEVFIEKKWHGQVGKVLKVQLFADGEEEVTVVENGKQVKKTLIYNMLDVENVTISNLLRVNNDTGKDVVYSVRQIEKDDNYKVTVSDGSKHYFTITNTNVEKVNVVVRKKWIGKRFDTTMELLEDGQYKGKQLVLAKDRNEVRFLDLPKYLDIEVTGTASPIDYKVREKGEDNGEVLLENIPYRVVWHAPITDSKGNSEIKVDNISQEKVTVKVRNEWVRRIGDSAEVTLLEKGTDNKVPGVAPIVLTKNDKEWENHPFSKQISVLKYDQTDGREYEFWIKETKINGQDINAVTSYNSVVEQVGQLCYCYKVVNTNTEAKDFTVNKVWMNGETKRPDSIQVTLKATVGIDTTDVIDAVLTGWINAPVKAQTLRKPNWEFVYAGLPKYYNNQEIKYSVVETPVALFDALVTTNADDAVVTNTFKPEKADVHAQKIWIGGTEAEHIELNLTLQYRVADSTDEADWVNWTGSADAVKENADNWKYTWKDVPQTDNQGKAYEFRALERQVPNNYQVEYNGLTITNTSFEKTSRKVVKTWLGDAKAVNVTLTGTVDGTEVYKVTKPIPAILDSNGLYQVEFKDLLRYDVQRTDGSGTTGREIEYKLVEESGADFELVSAPVWNEVNKAFLLTNRNTENKEITITKEWKNTPKALIDAAQVVVQLYQQSESTPEQTFSGPITLSEADYDTAKEKFVKTLSVPKFDVKGKAYTYAVKEISVNGKTPKEAGYRHTENGLTIVNTNDEKVTVEVLKSWQGPKKDVKFTLYKGNPNTASALEVEEKTLTTDQAKLSFAPVPKYENGKRNEYYVKEESLEGYNGTSAQKVDSEKPQVKFTNKNIENISITVNKVWENAPIEHQRDVEATLYVQNPDGNQEIVKVIPEQKVTLKQNNMPHTFTAPKYDAAGNALAYYVFETKVADISLNTENQKDNKDNYQIAQEEYELTIARNTEEGKVYVTLTNKNIQTATVKVAKEWQDGPAIKANVHLMKGDTVIASKGISGNAFVVFSEDANGLPLPKRENGSIIRYAVKEDAIAGYNNDNAADAQLQSDGSYLFVNHYTKTRDITVEKIWKPAKTNVTEVTVTLVGKVGDAVVVPAQTATLKADEGWKTIFTGLAEYFRSDKIMYMISEEDVENYPNPVIVDDSNNQNKNDKNVFTITNTYKNDDAVEISVNKVWKGFKTDSVTIALLRNGMETGDTLVLNEHNKWMGKFTGLKRMDDTAAATYTYDVKELMIPGYALKKSGSTEEGFTLTNTAKPTILEHKITLEVEKVFVGKEQDSAKVQILADGKPLADSLTITKNANGKWIGSKELPKYDANVVVTNTDMGQIKPIVYTVKELDDTDAAFESGNITLNGHSYTLKIESPETNKFKITNTSSAKTTIPVTKKWINKIGTKVEFDLLLENGSVYESMILENHSGNIWSGKFEVPTFDSVSGEKIAYKEVVETKVDDIEVSLSDYNSERAGDLVGGYTFTNTNVEKMTVKVVKKWLGNDAFPNGVNFKLYGNNAVTELSLAQNETEGTFAGEFSKYENGELVQYHLVEEPVEGYKQFGDIKKEVSGNTITFTVTNSKVKDITVQKAWVGTAADEVSVGLYQGDVQVKKLTLTAADLHNDVWTNTFKDVFVYDENGNGIDYVVRELNQDGSPVIPTGAGIAMAVIGGISYQLKIEVTEDVHKFTNTVLGEIEVETVWKGQNAEGATLALYDTANPDVTTVPIQLVRLPLANGEWKTTFKNLSTHTANGDKITYTVKQVLVNDANEIIQVIAPNSIFKMDETKYQLIESVDNGKLIFTNVQYFDITMKKVWDDKLPMLLREDVKFTLYSFEDGTTNFKKLEEFILNGSNGWMQTKTDLPRWIDDKFISYRVVEENIGGETIALPMDYTYPYKHKVFEVTADQSDVTSTAEVTITNGVSETVQPDDPDKRNIRVAKFWGTTTEEYQKEVEVELYVRDEHGNLVSTGKTLTLNKDNGWVAIFRDLPKYISKKSASLSMEQLGAEKEFSDEGILSGDPNGESTEITPNTEEIENKTKVEGENAESSVPAESPIEGTTEDNGTDTKGVVPEENIVEGDKAESTKEEKSKDADTEATDEVSLGQGGIRTAEVAEEDKELQTKQEGADAETGEDKEEVPTVAQTEDTKTEDKEETTIENEALPLEQPANPKVLAEYFIFETKIGGESIVFTPDINLIDYRFEEYQIKIATEGNNVYIKNLYETAIPDREKINVHVKKDWTGVEDRRIEDVEISLYVMENDALVKAGNEPLILGKSNNFEGSFTDLPKKNDAGVELKYYVFETKIGANAVSFTPEVDLTTYSFNSYNIFITDNGTNQVKVRNYYVEEPPMPYVPDDDGDDYASNGPGDNEDVPQGLPQRAEEPQETRESEQLQQGQEQRQVQEPKEPEKPVLPRENAPKETPKVENPIKEETVPQGKPELPKTSGMATGLFHLLGGSLLGLGAFIKRKKKK